MVRRIGFGDGGGESSEAVRRRGGRRMLDHGANRGARRRSTRETPPPAPEAAASSEHEDRAGPWGEERIEAPREAASQAADGPSRRDGVGLGKLIILVFLWTVFIGWGVSAYGGLAEAIWTFQAALNGYVDPVAALAPAAIPLIMGFFATNLILGRRRKKR